MNSRGSHWGDKADVTITKSNIKYKLCNCKVRCVAGGMN
jgi:hypothetical protein